MGSILETSLMKANEEGCSITSNKDEEDDFFSSNTWFQERRSHRSLKSKVQNLVITWLVAVLKQILTQITFLGEQVLVDLFTKYNTIIPSSAAVENRFSLGKDILKTKGATLSDGI